MPVILLRILFGFSSIFDVLNRHTIPITSIIFNMEYLENVLKKLSSGNANEQINIIADENRIKNIATFFIICKI